jgi:hypothetical protein
MAAAENHFFFASVLATSRPALGERFFEHPALIAELLLIATQR